MPQVTPKDIIENVSQVADIHATNVEKAFSASMEVERLQANPPEEPNKFEEHQKSMHEAMLEANVASLRANTSGEHLDSAFKLAMVTLKGMEVELLLNPRR